MKKPLPLVLLIVIAAMLAPLTFTPSPAEAQQPSFPTNVVATALSHTTIKLTWDPPSGGTEDYQIKIGTSPDPGGRPITYAGTSYQWNDLQVGTTYYMTVVACRDTCSSKAFASAKTFGTPPTTAPTGLTVTAGADNEVSLSWDRPSNNVTGYKWQYRAVGASDWTDGGEITNAGTTNASKTIADAQSTHLEFRVLTVNDRSDGPWSDPPVRLAARPGAPTTVTYSVTASTSVLVSWEPPEHTGGDGVALTGYQYEYSSDEGVNWTVGGTTEDGSINSVPISGLIADTDYLFRVRAENADRNGPYSANATLAQIYDPDNDGLIDIVNLAQLNAVRWDLNADGVVDNSNDADRFAAAFPDAAPVLGCLDTDADDEPGPCTGYELAVDLDFDTGTAGDRTDDDYYNDGFGWRPPRQYSGVFDGNGRTIANLHVDRPAESVMGLFSSIGRGGEVRNLGLTGVDINALGRIGGVAGASFGTIRGSYAVGTIRGIEGNVGGLVGQNSGTVINSYALVEVHGDSQVGGLLGSNTIQGGGVIGSYAAGTVSGRIEVGGLVGRNNDKIIRSFAAGTVNGVVTDRVDIQRSRHIGGLVGENGGIGGSDEGTIIASYAMTSVSGHDRVGGLVGANLNTGRIIASYAAGTVHRAASDSVDIGGLYGVSNPESRAFRGEITASYHDRDISGIADDHGRTTEELTGIAGYTGIFARWNRDLNGNIDDPWDFGDNQQYPALRVDLSDADTIATWQEFGYQTRRPLPLTVTRISDPEASLSWPDITETAWIGSPQASYVLYRDGAALTGYDGQMRSHMDAGLTVGQNYAYQVALLLDGVEFKRSREVSTEAASLSTDPSPLTERTLNGARLTVDLARTEYVSALEPEHFELLPATAGLSIARVNRVGNTRAILTLAFAGNFGSDLELTVTVASGANTAEATLTTNAVTVTPAPVPDQVAGVNAAGASASLDVTWDAAANADGYVVQWRLEGEPLYENSVIVPSGFATRTTLSNLLVETTYDVQVYATSHFAGDGPPSVTVTGTTLEFMAPPPPADAIVWHTVPCPLSEANLDGATITLALLDRSRLVWHPKPRASHFTLSGVPGVSVTGMAKLSDNQVALVLAYDDTDFDEDATLMIRIDGQALYSGGPISATTRVEAVVEEPPFGQVTGVRVTPGPRRITVNWDALPGAHGYKVQWQREGKDWQTDRFESRGRQRTLEGLRPGTEYTVRVIAVRDKAPYGDPSQAVTTTTPAFRVSISGTEPSPLTEYNLNEATVTIDLEGAEWALHLHGPRLFLDGHLIRPKGLPVWVEYVERASASRLKVTLAYRGGDIDKDAEGNDPTLTLELHEDTNGWAGATMEVPVEATDEAEGDARKPVVTKAKGTAGDDRIEVSWDSVPGATGYKLEWKGPGEGYDGSRQVVSPWTWFTISELDPELKAGDVYTVRVAAFIPRIGYGPWSDEKTANIVTPPEQPQPQRTAGVTVKPVRVTLPEGWTGSYGLSLDTQPTGNVSITMGSDNPDVTPYPNPVIFTPGNWRTEQLVAVPAARDDDAADDTARISHRVSGGNYEGVTVTSVTVAITDEDTAGITVSESSLVVSEGGSATYQVSLDTQPLDDVSISVFPYLVTAEPAQLTFTPGNWRNPQTVTVRATQDDNTEDEQAAITHGLSTNAESGYAGVAIPNVSITVTDDDGDREVLRDFYHATGGENWTNNANWLSNKPLDQWHGITVDDKGQVTALVLDGNNLAGSLPSELGNLSNLTRLALNRNQLTGSIPSELGNLSNLSIIGLANNQLSGALPANLGNLGGLTRLSLHDNTALSGLLPSGFGEMPGLTRLAVSRTGLSGHLPQGLVDNNVMQYLHFDETGLCAPNNEEFEEWLDGVPDKNGATCDP